MYLNGVLLKPTTDYNTNTANTIAGLTATVANDEVTVIVYDVFAVGDTVSAVNGGTFTGNVTFGGDISVGDDLTVTDDVAITGKTGMGISSTDVPDGGLHIHTGSSGSVSANAHGDELVVESSGRGGISILTPDANESNILFGSPSDNLGGFITYKHSNTTMEIGTSISSGLVKVYKGDCSLSTTFEADGDVNIADGNLIFDSGHGIDFSATGDGSATDTSELLDDYEEGTWVPTITGSSNPSFSTSVAAGKYIKVGNLVFVQWNMIITGVSSQGSGNAQVGGLPYASNCNTYQGHIGIMYNDVWDTEIQKGYVPNGQSHIQLAPDGRTQSNFGFASTLGTGYFGGGGSYITG